MIAQVNLTPTESKKLMVKAIARIGVVKEAAKEGMIVIHPSSSTYFLSEALTGENPRYDNWVCGSITPKGLCVEMGIMSSGPPRDENKALGPGGFPFQVVVKGGETSQKSKATPVSVTQLRGMPEYGLPIPCRKEGMGSMNLWISIFPIHDLKQIFLKGE